MAEMRGYPSNDEYMRLVGDAGLEAQRNQMREDADEQTRRYARSTSTRTAKRAVGRGSSR
jgi:hypothetical protein